MLGFCPLGGKALGLMPEITFEIPGTFDGKSFRVFRLADPAIMARVENDGSLFLVYQPEQARVTAVQEKGREFVLKKSQPSIVVVQP